LTSSHDLHPSDARIARKPLSIRPSKICQSSASGSAEG
jgi:hypothetical protein